MNMGDKSLPPDVMSGMRSTATISKIQPDAIQIQLESAREVQRSFFPYRLPPVDGLDYYGACRTVEQVGGDFFDFFAPRDSVLTLSIGDVSGKGVPAALIMASLQASLRALASNGHPSLSAVVNKLSVLLSDGSSGNFYATMFFGQMDAKRHELRYVSAGHEPVLLLRDKARCLIPLASTGPALGIFRHAGYRETVLSLIPGDILVAVTDGVSEAVDSNNPESYEELVLDAVRRHPNAGSSELVEDILRGVENLRSETTPADDRTVVVVRALRPEAAAAGEHHREAELIGCCKVAST